MDDRSPDEPFLEFLHACCSAKIDLNAKQRAIDYVTGFNAADPGRVGVHWLVKGMRAEERIEGDRSFRPRRGYEDLIEIFRRQLADAGVSTSVSSVVETIRWKKGGAEVHGPGPMDHSRLQRHAFCRPCLWESCRHPREPTQHTILS